MQPIKWAIEGFVPCLLPAKLIGIIVAYIKLVLLENSHAPLIVQLDSIGFVEL